MDKKRAKRWRRIWCLVIEHAEVVDLEGPRFIRYRCTRCGAHRVTERLGWRFRRAEREAAERRKQDPER